MKKLQAIGSKLGNHRYVTLKAGGKRSWSSLGRTLVVVYTSTKAPRINDRH